MPDSICAPRPEGWCETMTCGPHPAIGGECSATPWLRPPGGKRWQGPRLPDGGWRRNEIRSRSYATDDTDHSDVLHIEPVRITDHATKVKRMRDALAAVRRSDEPAVSLAGTLGVEPSHAATPKFKGLGIKSRAALRGNVVDRLLAPNKTRGLKIVSHNPCEHGTIEKCSAKLAEDVPHAAPLPRATTLCDHRSDMIAKRRRDKDYREAHIPFAEKVALPPLPPRGVGRVVAKLSPAGGQARLAFRPDDARPNKAARRATAEAIRSGQIEEQTLLATQTAESDADRLYHENARAIRAYHASEKGVAAYVPRPDDAAPLADLTPAEREHEKRVNAARAAATYRPATIAERLRAERFNAAK